MLSKGPAVKMARGWLEWSKKKGAEAIGYSIGNVG